MGAQTRYGYSTAIGVAGGIADIAPHAIDTFLNEEENGVMEFGIAAVKGTKAGIEIKKPSAASDVFEGITVNNRTTEMDIVGNCQILKGAAIGVMRYGRVYAKVATGVTVAYGEPVFVIATGDEAGYVTNVEGSNIAIKARFLGTKDAAGVAEVELFNEAQ